MANDNTSRPEGITSLLDTDLYKLTMQNAILKHFPDVKVSYKFTNRTPHMRLNKQGFDWLKEQISKLGDIRISQAEISWLEKACPYFGSDYLKFLGNLQLRPVEQVGIQFGNTTEVDGQEYGDIDLAIHGLWTETILYEIPLLALISEAYFKFVDKDWTHDDQIEMAKEKGLRLLEAGVVFSEFGSRRRRDLHTHILVMTGLTAAAAEATKNGWHGKLSGTSNVHLAMQFDVSPVGTVAHEWFMGIAALTNDYAQANEAALQYWIATYGPGTLGIALTDTFGTPDFLRAFSQPVPRRLLKEQEHAMTYAEAFIGVRQDSGDPIDFVKLMQEYYTDNKIKDKKTIIFSDSLDVAKCIKYKAATDAAGLTPSFGVGTHFTNDFQHLSNSEKSTPLNIVIKLSEADGRAAVKLSDNIGKNMGPQDLIDRVKHDVHYSEKSWSEGDEAHRWD